MNIPDKVMEAAARAGYKVQHPAFDPTEWELPMWEATVNAMAPFIAADAREELELVKAERDWLKEQLAQANPDTLAEYAQSLEDPL